MFGALCAEALLLDVSAHLVCLFTATELLISNPRALVTCFLIPQFERLPYLFPKMATRTGLDYIRSRGTVVDCDTADVEGVW